MKAELRRLTTNVDEESFNLLKEGAEREGDTSSNRLRGLIARDVVRTALARNAVAVLPYIEKLKGKKVDTLMFRVEFDSLDVPYEEKERAIRELESALSIKSREYGILKEMVDESEFLGLTTRGAYKPVVLKTLAGLGIAYSKIVDEWIDSL